MESPQPSAQSVVAQPAQHFHVPHERNRYYVDREGIIQSLKERLTTNSRMVDLHGHAVTTANSRMEVLRVGIMARSRMVVLHGHAGTGKTQCALELCWRLRLEMTRFNIFWVSGDKARFSTDYSSIANAIVPEATGTVESLETVTSLLEFTPSVSPWILVVDGVDMADFPYFPILPRTPGGNILFTSMTNNLPVQSGISFDSICVGKMSASESAKLLSTSPLAVHEPESVACQRLLRELDYDAASVARAAAFLLHTKSSHTSISWYLSKYMTLKNAQDESMPGPRSEPEGEAKDPDE